MINVETQTDHPACIVFGQPIRGSQQAAWFTEPEIEVARKQKNAKTLAFLAPIPSELDEVAKTLPRGRLQAGQIGLTKVAPDVYAKLLAGMAARRQQEIGQAASVMVDKTAVSAGATPAEDQTKAEATIVPVTGDGWQQLKVGDLVLARWSLLEEGWWAARILKIDGDSFTLAWVDETVPLAQRNRAQLALVHPKLI